MCGKWILAHICYAFGFAPRTGCDRESIVPLPKVDELVVFESFMKVGLRFPLHKMLVEVLKTFEIYLH
jgi:hypothetical protein